MLDFLKISNLALIDSLSLDFGSGFICVTGETGAGKSVILGALSMLAGNRCGREIVGNFGDTCVVEGSISLSDARRADAILEACGLPRCEDGALIISRSVSKAKGGRIFINGALAPLSVLAKLGAVWIDFHGPGEPQKLFSARSQLEMLDAMCGGAEAFAEYARAYGRLRRTLSEMEELSHSKRLSPEEAEFLKSRIAEIDEMKISEDSIVQLEQSYKIAEMASDISEKSAAIVESLTGADSAAERLRACNRLAADLAGELEAAEGLAERISAAVVEIDDISSEFESLARASEMSPAQIESVRAKMSAWMGISRRYGATASAVLAARDEMARRIELQTDVGASLDRLRAERDGILKELEPLAEKIFALRRRAAQGVAREVAKLLKNLGFKRPEFKIELSRDSEPSGNFGSSCEFYFSANAGQPPKPLAKVASSGELARLMLALKSVLAEADETPVLVFDEVDANVGGEVGAEVGRQLSRLSRGHQVFCITHLPQVAARADAHFLVEKFQKRDSTKISVGEISGDAAGRVSELARMLGDRNSESAIAHARELLKGG